MSKGQINLRHLGKKGGPNPFVGDMAPAHIKRRRALELSGKIMTTEQSREMNRRIAVVEEEKKRLSSWRKVFRPGAIVLSGKDRARAEVIRVQMATNSYMKKHRRLEPEVFVAMRRGTQWTDQRKQIILWLFENTNINNTHLIACFGISSPHHLHKILRDARRSSREWLPTDEVLAISFANCVRLSITAKSIYRRKNARLEAALNEDVLRKMESDLENLGAALEAGSEGDD